MKIIDTCNDYYDFAGHGIDEDIILDRTRQKSMVIEEILPMPTGVEFKLRPATGCQDGGYIAIMPSFAVVGGMGIPMVRVIRTNHDGEDRRNYFTKEDVKKLLLAITKESGSKTISRALKIIVSETSAFLDAGMRDLTEFCVRHRIIVGELAKSTPFLSRTRAIDPLPRMVFSSTLLRDIGLDLVLPAHEAHMLVSRFVGGILTTEIETVDISDRSRILKAGFDIKTSFRKRPENDAEPNP